MFQKVKLFISDTLKVPHRGAAVLAGGEKVALTRGLR